MGGLVALLVGAIEGWILGVDSSSVREGEVGLNRIQNRNSGDEEQPFREESFMLREVRLNGGEE